MVSMYCNLCVFLTPGCFPGSGGVGRTSFHNRGQEVKHVLEEMGIVCIEAPGEAEAMCAALEVITLNANRCQRALLETESARWMLSKVSSLPAFRLDL